MTGNWNGTAMRMLGMLLVLGGAALAADVADEPDAEPGGARQQALVKRGVELVLSHVLEVPVELGEVIFERDAELVTLKDLRIANPRGFRADDAIRVDALAVEAPMRELFGRNPVLRLVQVKGAAVESEMGLRGSNLQRLLRSADRLKNQPLLAPLAPLRQKTWRIERVTFDDAFMNITVPFLSNRKASLDALEMSFLGEDGQGLPADEAVRQLLRRLIEEAELTAQERDPEAPSGAGRIIEEVIRLF